MGFVGTRYTCRYCSNKPHNTVCITVLYCNIAMGHSSDNPAAMAGCIDSSDKWWVPKKPQDLSKRLRRTPGGPGEAPALPRGRFARESGDDKAIEKKKLGSNCPRSSTDAANTRESFEDKLEVPYRPQGVVRSGPANPQAARQQTVREEDAPKPCRRCGRPREWKSINHVPMHPKDSLLLARLG
jgi:hypothetical protein